MKPTIKYLWLTIKHKSYVFRAGLKTKAPIWRLIIHDWSKFLPDEAPHYGKQFFGAADDPKGFIHCWVRHQNRHPHHWEYWIPRTGHNRCTPPYLDNDPVPMPEWAVREMVADWYGASRAYNGAWPVKGEWDWLNNNYPHCEKADFVIVVKKVANSKELICTCGFDDELEASKREIE